MTKTLNIATATLLLGLTSLSFACDYPARAEVPNGATATRDEMLAGQQSVKTYIAAMEEYLVCIEQEESDTVAEMQEIGDEERFNREDALSKKHNAAVEDMELVAARFNEAVRAYRAQAD